MKTPKRILITGGLTACALFLASCGGNPSSAQTGSGSTAAQQEIGPVVISGLVVGSNAALPLAIKEGVFEDHDLNVEFNSGLDAGTQLPALTTGDTHFSVCNLISTLTAIDQGLDIRLVSGFNYTKDSQPDANAVVVKSDSGIESFADLSGKTVSVTSLQSQGDLMIKEATKLADGNPEEINFSELPFPDMQAQLELGNTDAIWLPEPFLSIALESSELETLGYSYYEVQPGSPVQMICADGDFVDNNPEVVDRMHDALEDVAHLATEDEDQLRAELVEFTAMPDELASGIMLENYDTEIRDSVEVINQLAAEYDIISSPVDLEAVVVD